MILTVNSAVLVGFVVGIPLNVLFSWYILRFQTMNDCFRRFYTKLGSKCEFYPTCEDTDKENSATCNNGGGSYCGRYKEYATRRARARNQKKI